MQEFENTAIDKNCNQDCKYYNTCYLQVRNGGKCFNDCKDKRYTNESWRNNTVL